MNARHVLITGGGGGLGLDVTAAMLDAGATVTATTFGTDDTQLRARLGARAGAVQLIAADLRDVDEADAVVTAMPRVDALIHLVGGFGMGPTADASAEQYRSLIDVNLTTTFAIVKAVLGPMAANNHGRIVAVASRSAVEPVAEQAIYSAAKAAVLAFIRSVAAEYREQDITANAVLPSIIDTPANRQAMGDANASTWVSPASLASSIAYLASPGAGDLRGTALQVYGGA